MLAVLLNKLLALMKLDLAPLTRFLQHLPKNGDVELALLKCHLLIEEVLTKLIARSTKHPEFLPKVRLSFAQKVWLARTITNLGEESWSWEALRRLNEARNELAHGLLAQELNGKLDEFIRVVEDKHGAPADSVIGGPFGRFQWAAFTVFSFFSHHAHFDPTALKISTLLTSAAPSAEKQ